MPTTNKKAFFDTIRYILGPFTQKQVEGFDALLDATEGLPISHRAYILATVWHETGRTMQPIREFGRGRGKPYGVPGRNGGQIPYGRGYVQLTWDDNYEEMDREIGAGGTLIRDYDKALDPRIAADILVIGMVKGKFDGKRRGLKHFLPNPLGTREEFRQARRTVNIMDKADLIAGYALTFQKGLT